ERLRDEALQAGSQVHARRPRVDRGDGDRVCVRAVDPLDRDAVADADPGVATDDRLDPDEPLAFVLLLGPAHDGWRGLAAPDLDDVAEAHLEPLARLDVETGGPQADVLLERFGDPQGERLDHGRRVWTPVRPKSFVLKGAGPGDPFPLTACVR